MMNPYGARAMKYWQDAAPTRYADLENPSEFFTDLGEQIATYVEQLASAMEAKATFSQDTMTRFGELNAIKASAEEVAMHELAYVEPEDEDEEPAWDSLSLMLQQLKDDAEIFPEDAQTEQIKSLERLLATRPSL